MEPEVKKTFVGALLRRKPIEQSPVTKTRLDRCLNTVDLVTLGIGSTLGLGVYILAGQVAANKAGPSVTLSFFIAAVASVFAGLCYAEFGARVPKAGSAYVYSYITVGEFMAFVIGWNLILEYAIGSASIARGYSGYVDSLADNWLSKTMTKYLPLNIGTSQYFDVFAFFIAILLAVLLAIGVKKSTRLNAFFTLINLLGVFYAMICGSFKLDWHNWQLRPDEIPDQTKYGVGGFFPFGFNGMMKGAATCFYGFIGFDMIATTGEEVKNPAKSIPLSIIGSLAVIFVSYCGVSAVQTLMVPYYEQNQLAPLPYVFNRVGYSFAGWILTAGAMAGLYSSLLGSMYPLTRVLYAMANDGMIFRFFSRVHSTLKTPLIATAFAGLFSGAMAGVFDFQELADMMSIGTLLAYTLVAVSVLILRYQNRHQNNENDLQKDQQTDVLSDDDVSALLSDDSSLWTRIFNTDNLKTVTERSAFISLTITAINCGLIMVFCVQITFFQDMIFHLDKRVLAGLLVNILALSVGVYALRRQPQTDEKMSFKIPGVPFIPLLSVFVNFYLMLNLSTLTWIRFGVWMFFGFLMYFLYGIWKSDGFLSDEDKENWRHIHSIDSTSEQLTYTVSGQESCDKLTSHLNIANQPSLASSTSNNEEVEQSDGCCSIEKHASVENMDKLANHYNKIKSLEDKEINDTTS